MGFRSMRVLLVAVAVAVCGLLGVGAPCALAGLDGYSQWIETDRVASPDTAAEPESDAVHGNGVGRGNGAPQDGREMSEQELKAEITKLWGEEAGKKMHKAKPTLVPYRAKTWATMSNEPSDNWCGYKSKVTGIYGATGVMTAKRCYNGDSGVFVGVTDDDNELIQAGVDMQTMTAFVECLPANAQTVFSVAQNDRILASVRRQTSNSWTAVIYDLTTGMAYGKYYTYYGPSRYASWILETQRGEHSGSWGTVNFSQCSWLDTAGSSHSMTSGTGYYYRKVMRNWLGETVTPSSISGGWAFSVTRN